MAKKFTTRFDTPADEQAAESKRVNKLIRSGRGKSVTVGGGKPDKTSVEMAAWIREQAGRGEAPTLEGAAKLAKESQFTASEIKTDSALAKSLSKMSDEQLEAALVEADKGRKPSGGAGSGTGTRQMMRKPRSISDLIRLEVQMRKRLLRGER